MKPWLRLTVVTLAIGGGFSGFSLTIMRIPEVLKTQPVYLVIAFLFLALYAFVTASGIACVQKPERTAPLIFSFAIQIPLISSAFITYRFFAGFHVTIGVTGGGFFARCDLGSGWFCGLFQNPPPFGLGINLFALLMVVLLIRSHRAVLRDIEEPLKR